MKTTQPGQPSQPNAQNVPEALYDAAMFGAKYGVGEFNREAARADFAPLERKLKLYYELQFLPDCYENVPPSREKIRELNNYINQLLAKQRQPSPEIQRISESLSDQPERDTLSSGRSSNETA